MTEKMKPSGITWIDDIPETWKVKKLRFILDDNGIKVGPFGSSISSGDYCDEGKWVYNQRTVLDDEFSNADAYISEEKYREMIGFKVNAGDMLITSRGTIGKVAIVPEGAPEGILHPCIIKFSIDKEQVVDRLIKKVFNETDFIREQLGYLSNATTIDVIYSYTLKDIYLPIAPINEQCAIADFLDTKCAQIDSVISDIEKQIETLQKYKKSLITEAVTKGLDRTVPMKDSGFEWIGEVPITWNVRPLKHLANNIIDGTHHTPTYVDDGIPFLRVTDITSEDDVERPINLDVVARIPVEEHRELLLRCAPQKGDLLVSKNGTIGVPKIIDWDWEFSMFVSLCLIKLGKTLLNKWLYYYFKSYLSSTEIAFGGKTNTITNLHLEKIANFKIPLPPIDEQIEICNHLDKKMLVVDEMLKTKKQQVKLIEQHKKSLIYEYVTGKKRVTEVN